MKIAHLTSVHVRTDTRIFYKECSSLAKNGYQVSLIVADGKGDDLINDVTIYDVGRATNRFARVVVVTERVFKKALELDCDVYHIHDPELIIVALSLKRKGKHVIFDIHEMTHLQIMSKAWIPLPFRKIVSVLYSYFEKQACKKFDFLITPQDQMTAYFSKFQKAITISNYPDHNFVYCKNKSSRFNIIYSGSISEARGLYNYIELIEKLVVLDSRYKLILACPLTSELHARVNSSVAKKNIDLAGYVSFDRLLEYYACSTFGLILFNNVGQYYMANALKLFEYMGSGLIVIMPDFGEWVDFNVANNAGFNVKTSSAEVIANCINNISDDQIEKIALHNHEIVLKRFAWATEEVKLLNVYEEVVSYDV